MRGVGRKGDSTKWRRSDRGSRKVHGVRRREVSARRSRTRQRQATCVIRQAVSGADWNARIILHGLDGGLDVMLCWGPNYECNLY